MIKLLTGVAASALAASVALAGPGPGGGQGHGDDHQPKGIDGPARSEQDRGGKHERKPGPAGTSRAPKGHASNAGPKPDKAPHPKAPEHEARKADHAKVPSPASETHRIVERPEDAGERDRHRVVKREVERVVSRRVDNDRVFRISTYNHGLVDGCPPGLRKKHNGCLPPGQAKRLRERRTDWSRPAYFGYADRNDGRYLYDDGYLLRLNDGGDVLGYLPLLGGALSIGNPWPDYYQPVQVPDYYVDYYNLGPQGGYRYADDVLYRVDPQNSAITSIAALLTGDRFDVGKQMPPGYDVYNVPYAYQDRYYDTPDANYRYADGYVYQVDPTTQLIQAAIELLI